jgi:hypothetical protein
VGTSQRFGLAARGVQGPHELEPRPLAQGLIVDQRLQVADGEGGLRALEERLGSFLDRHQPELFQADGLGARPPLVRELAQRRTAPPPQRRVEGGHGVAGRRGYEAPTFDEGVLEPVGVDRGPVDVEHVPRWSVGELHAGRVAQGAPQLRQVGLEGRSRRGGWIVAPERVGQLVERDQLPPSSQQCGEQDTGRGSERSRAAGPDDVDAAEQAQVHVRQCRPGIGPAPQPWADGRPMDDRWTARVGEEPLFEAGREPADPRRDRCGSRSRTSP